MGVGWSRWGLRALITRVRVCDAHFDENRESGVRGDEGGLDTIARCRPYLQYNDLSSAFEREVP